VSRQDKWPGHNPDPTYPRPPCPPAPPRPTNDKQQAASSDIAGLIEAAKAMTATAEALLQSVAMLAGAVAQLLEEEAGTPAPPEEPAKPEPADLDAD
jgi:hypothetical protein